MMTPLAKIFIIVGLLFLLGGGLIYLSNRLNLPLGRLPGDIHIQRHQFQVYIPITTSILLSIIASLALSLLVRLFNRH